MFTAACISAIISMPVPAATTAARLQTVPVRAEAQAQCPTTSARAANAIHTLIQKHQPAAEGDANAYDLLITTLDRIDAQFTALEPARRDALLAALENAGDADAAAETRQRARPLASEALALYGQAGAFEALDRIAATPRAIPPAPPAADAAHSPDAAHLPDAAAMQMTSRARSLARALSARFLLAIEDGDADTAVSTYTYMLALARVLSQQLSLIPRLTGDAIIPLANQHIRDAALNGHLRGEALAAAAAALQRQSQLRPPLAATLENERLLIIDALDTMTPGGDPQLLAPFREQTVQWLDRRFDAAKSLSEFTPHDRKSDPAALRAGEQLSAVEPLPLPYTAAAHSVGVLPRLLHTEDLVLLDIAATRLTLALELHRHRTGAYPATLADLAPRELDRPEALAATSYGLIYHKRADTYTLYSPGHDLTDNGGAAASAPHLALNGKEPGTDRVYR